MYIGRETEQTKETKMNSTTSNWVNRINASKPVMYSVAGAKFQEYALSILDAKNSTAHKSIGSFVTAINNNQISVEQATEQYVSLLSK